MSSARIHQCQIPTAWHTMVCKSKDSTDRWIIELCSMLLCYVICATFWICWCSDPKHVQYRLCNLEITAASSLVRTIYEQHHITSHYMIHTKSRASCPLHWLFSFTFTNIIFCIPEFPYFAVGPSFLFADTATWQAEGNSSVGLDVWFLYSLAQYTKYTIS